MSLTGIVDVDLQVYYDAASALGTAAVAFGHAVDNRWSALADCEQMAGSYDDARTWAADYDARAAEVIDTSMLLADAARGYAILLGEMGYNHAVADHDSVIGNTAPAPLRPTDPDWISLVNRPSLPSAGGPGQGLVAEGLSGAVDLLDEVGVIIPDGNTGKLANAQRIWSEMAADEGVTEFAQTLNRIADSFAAVTTPEAVFVDEDLRAMATSATEIAATLSEIAQAVGDHLTSLEDLRNKLKDQLIELGKEIGKEVLIGIGLSMITAGFGAALATARGAAAVKKFAGPIRALVIAFKSAKISKGVKTTHHVVDHQPTLKQIQQLAPQRTTTTAPVKPPPAPVKPAPAPAPTRVALSEGDKTALSDYTDEGFEVLNPALRNGEIDPLTQSRIDAVNSALDKLPDHSGLVTRHTHLSEDVLARYQQGETVVESAFTSTSKNGAGASGWFADGANVEMQIISKTGKDVSAWSASHWEEEVLFRSGTAFECVQRFTDPVTGRTVLRLVEQ